MKEEQDKEEYKIPEEHLLILSEDIRNILQRNNLIRSNILIFLYLNLPKPILHIIEEKLGLPNIDSEDGITLNKLIRLLKTEELKKIERRNINARILYPYWERIEREDKARRERKAEYRKKYIITREPEDISRHKQHFNILEKYNMAMEAKDSSKKIAAKKYGVSWECLNNWVNDMHLYKYALDLNPIFGGYNSISSPLIRNYKIGKFEKEKGVTATLKEFDISETRLLVLKRWYKYFMAGEINYIRKLSAHPKKTNKIKQNNKLKKEANCKNNSDNLEDTLVYEEEDIKTERRNTNIDIPPQEDLEIKEESQIIFEYPSQASPIENTNNNLNSNNIPENIKSEMQDEDYEDNRKPETETDWVVKLGRRPNKLIEDKVKERTLQVKYQTLERIFGVIVLKERFGFTSEEISRVFHPLSKHLVETYYNIYINTGGYNELIMKKIYAIVRRHPPQYDPTQVANAKPYIEQFIHKSLTKDKLMPQLSDITTYLNTVPGFEGIGRYYTAKILKNIGYSYKKIKVNVADKTKTSVLRQKEIYLREYFDNHTKILEGKGKAEVYVDESFVIDRHFRRFCWTKGNNKNNNTRKERNIKIEENNNIEMERHPESVEILNHNRYHQICIVAAIGINGWIGVKYEDLVDKLVESEINGIYKYGSIMYFKAINREEKDAHLNFNKCLFGEYFQSQLIPSLDNDSDTENNGNGSLIIMDQCAYHTPLKEGSFNPRKASRTQLLEWLLGRGIYINNMKAGIQELRKLVEVNGGLPNNYLQDILDTYYGNNGNCKHKILFQPPYHPEFNPIEICWGLLKYTIHRNYVVLDTHKICTEDLPTRFGKITGVMVRKLYKRLEEVVLTKERLKDMELKTWGDSRRINEKQATILARKWKLDS